MAVRTQAPSHHDSWHPGRRGREEGGFTLIELLVVIVILGILSAVVVFAVRGVGDKGQSAALGTDAKTIRTAEESYCAKFGHYGTKQDLVDAKLLSENSGYTGVSLNAGGNCGAPANGNSGFSLITSTAATVNVAANADQWITSDSGSGAGYSSSAFVYPLNSNLNEPLLLMKSDYTITGGLASGYERIAVGTSRDTVPGMTAGTPAPLPTSTSTPYPTCGGKTDRPFCSDTWRFHLRPGVTFHDGQPFNADDVMWTWRDRQPLSGSASDGENTLGFTMALSGTSSATCSTDVPTKLFCNWDSVEKIDALTVDVTPRIQNLRFPEQVLHPKGAIAEVLRDAGGIPIPAPGSTQTPNLSSPRNLGRHLDGSTGGLVANTKVFGFASSPTSTPLATGTPQGTGPFKYVSYSPTSPQGGGTASFVMNPTYWGPKAQVAGMNYTFIADPLARTAGLKSGQYDMAIDLNPLDTTTVSAAPFNDRVISAPFGQNALIYVNKVVKTSPTTLTTGTAGPATPTGYTFNIGTDPAVRRAASLAINRDNIVTGIFNGNAQPGRWMSPPGILGPYANSVVPALITDVVAAKSGLDADGWTCANGGPPGAPGAKTPCAGNTEIRKWNGDARFTVGRQLDLYMIGISLVPQTEYDLMAGDMKAAGINLVTERGNCDQTTASCPGGGVGRGQMYASSMWDFDLELPNQNDANPAFLPVLRQACTNQTGNFRFAPADGTNGVGAAVTDTSGNGNGTFPFGNTPCTSPGAMLGAIDTPGTGYVALSNAATTADANQSAAANMMHILVNQDQSNIVIPVVGQYRIYGMTSKVNLGDPHPSQTSQRWVSLTKTG